jgi:hypothetical protein
VLYGALTFLSIKNPGKAIFPRRDTLRAESLLQSEPTLYRGLADLERKGYITRDQSRNSRTGKFYLSPITFTEKALVLLGLTKVIHKGPSSTMRDGHIKKELTKSGQSLQNTTGKPDSDEENPIDRKTGLPTELVPLLDLHVGKAAICWLMREAKRYGKRLGNVVSTVKHRIQTLRGREVVSYLKSMIVKDLDYAWIAAAKAKDDAAHSNEMAANQALASLNQRYNGFEVVRRDGMAIGVFEACANGTSVVRGSNGSMPVNLRFAQAYLEGEVLLRPSGHYVM